MVIASGDYSFIEESIKSGIRDAVSAAAPSIIEEAKERMEVEIRASLDKIALSVLQHYDMQYQRGEIVIRVKKDI